MGVVIIALRMSSSTLNIEFAAAHRACVKTPSRKTSPAPPRSVPASPPERNDRRRAVRPGHRRPRPATARAGRRPRRTTLQRPLPLQSASTGQAMRRPAARSAASCSRSMVAAARYSSQIAWTCAGSRSASIYAARTSARKRLAGEPQPPSASSMTASGAAASSRSGSGSGCASSDHGQNAVATARRRAPRRRLRQDIEHGETIDALRMIERQPIGDPAAAIVPGDREAREPESHHDRHHVVRHRPLGVGRMVRIRGRTAAAAVAAQVGTDDGEVAREQRRHAAPHQVRLRKPCSRRTGGPDPPRRRKMLVSSVCTSSASKSVHDTESSSRRLRSVVCSGAVSNRCAPSVSIVIPGPKRSEGARNRRGQSERSIQGPISAIRDPAGQVGEQAQVPNAQINRLSAALPRSLTLTP